MEFKQESIVSKVLDYYPRDYWHPVEEVLCNLGKLKPVCNNVALALHRAAEQMGFDNWQTDFVLLCARAKPFKNVHPQMYIYCANFMNPKEEPVKEGNLQVLLENAEIYVADVSPELEKVWKYSKDLDKLYSLWDCARNKIPYSGEIIKKGRITTIITPGRHII